MQIDGVPRGTATLATNSQVETGSEASLDAERHGNRIPVATGGNAGDRAVDQAAEDLGIVRRCAAARIVSDIGEHNRLGGRGQRGIDSSVDAVMAREAFLAHPP